MACDLVCQPSNAVSGRDRSGVALPASDGSVSPYLLQPLRTIAQALRDIEANKRKGP